MQNFKQKKELKVQVNDTLDKTFKEYAKLISQSVQKLNGFTDNLQGKVNTMLKAQQTQFVQAYKGHMNNIKTQLKNMDNKLQQYQQKINYYENQSRLAHYIKKVKFMQKQQIQLYQLLQKKDKKLKQFKFEIQMLTKQKKVSDDKLKEIMRLKIDGEENKTSLVESRQKLDIDNNSISQKNIIMTERSLMPKKLLSSIQTFTTQIPNYYYNSRRKLGNQKNKNINLITEDQENSYLFKSHQISSTLKKQLSVESIQKDEVQYKITTLQKQIKALKQHNKKLLLFNSKYANNLSELGQFFIKTVQQLKRNIAAKRKIKSNISFEQFCKQDKLVLIATLLSNQSALLILYDKIFKPDIKKNRAQSVLQKSYGKNHNSSLKKQRSIQQIMTNPQKQFQIANKGAFPSIKSRRIMH